MADIIPPVRLPFMNKAAFDFSGGDLTSDGGLMVLGELGSALGLKEKLISNMGFHQLRQFDDADLVAQKAMLIAAGYHSDDDATGLRHDPAFVHLFGKLASQETISRRFSGMGEGDVGKLNRAINGLHDTVAARDMATECVIDIDTTLLAAFGRQDGRAWNCHYSAAGFHPVIATETLTRDVVGFELRPGAQYCSKDSGSFLEGVLGRMGTRHPAAALFVRGDAGFSAPEVYAACEAQGAKYAVRLKENASLHKCAEGLAALLEPGEGKCVYREFGYRAGSWDRPRRVVCKCEMKEAELLPRFTFVVTNMDSRPESVIGFYCKRGSMELIIGELKGGFLKNCVQSHSRPANEFRCLVGILSYSLMNWLRRLMLPEAHQKEKTATVRMRFIKVAAKRAGHARTVLFRLPTSYPYKNAFYRMLGQIWRFSSA